MTEQEIKDLVVECAEKLGRVPSYFEVAKLAKITRRQIRKHFGCYSAVLNELQMERENVSGHRVPLDKLFPDWAAVVRKLKKAPSMSEYEIHSKYSCKPLVRCFGSWRQVAHGLKQYAEERGQGEWTAELDAAVAAGGEERAVRPAKPAVPEKEKTALLSGPTYGPLMWPSPLAHGPVNELGVVFLFGTLAQQLGFVVLRLQPEFPDCEAMRRVDEDTWQRVRIEFEYESRNFLRHMHEASECDLIICWRHNWPECPLEVLELKGLVDRMIW